MAILAASVARRWADRSLEGWRRFAAPALGGFVVALVGIVGILLWLDWRLALVTFAILPPTLLMTWFFRLRMRRTYRGIRRVLARLNAFLQESVSGMRIIQLFSREPAGMRQFREISFDEQAILAGSREQEYLKDDLAETLSRMLVTRLETVTASPG